MQQSCLVCCSKVRRYSFAVSVIQVMLQAHTDRLQQQHQALAEQLKSEHTNKLQSIRAALKAEHEQQMQMAVEQASSKHAGQVTLARQQLQKLEALLAVEKQKTVSLKVVCQ